MRGLSLFEIVYEISKSVLNYSDFKSDFSDLKSINCVKFVSLHLKGK